MFSPSCFRTCFITVWFVAAVPAIADQTDAGTFPATTQPVSTAATTTYQVRQGETLFTVVRNTGVPITHLIRLNRLAAPYHLYAGQVLQLAGGLPSPDPEPADGDYGYIYRVNVGDTLYGIMRKTGVPVARLIDLNQLSTPYAIQAGQALKLRDDGIRL
ncbi:MAG TPA: LysM peptidoglycan-binding domain-containing protein [Candidatus Thiothrix moscowensis]|uniref:LysM peptidoglycan-binding domain-containing protein n=1 Tax=unclassified Thiothrix TaxID=2636184 RepID=UPI0025FD0CEB|nr:MULTISPECIES: LysM peptidoglycan-binding domain-containing protein [unclassified Thiothrix]HRJ52253.1 LysM peptidoglycan-binding domain-containing protein [Candidatus Thiothrix moscowensis]HRJ92568.1 LysM peptidoglycan-binding domain-containing protein [Candidatus Thiothrix moscowensis]